MLVFLVIFSTNIQLTQSEPCSKRTVYQICSAPLDCPTQYKALRNSCAQKYARKQLVESSPTPEIFSTWVITFPSVTYHDIKKATEVNIGNYFYIRRREN